MLLTIGPMPAADAGECLSVWIDPEKRPAQCEAADVRKDLARQPDLCLAASPEKAVLRVKVTDCLEGPKAAIPIPAAALIEYVIHAQVTEGKVSKELSGRDNHSWQGAARELSQAIEAWHRGQSSPPTDNAELARISREDQDDRKPGLHGIDWAKVKPRDDARLARTRELYASGALRTGADWFHAALILQHSSEADDYLLAHEMSVAAVAHGDGRAAGRPRHSVPC
jgi:hypothetical protein